MHVLILGGDGYLGWPTAMYFSKRGYAVTVVDNYFRRNACTELDLGMLYPVPTLIERAKIWHERTGLEIKVVISDLTDPEVMRYFDAPLSRRQCDGFVERVALCFDTYGYTLWALERRDGD